MSVPIALEFEPAEEPASPKAADDPRPRKEGHGATRSSRAGRPFRNAWNRRLGRSSLSPEPTDLARRLSALEERWLVYRRKAGDPDAERELVTANLALVLHAARDYKQRGVPLDDLIQEGNLGLIRAAHHFDPLTHSARFATYATYWIRCFIVRALTSNSLLLNHPRDIHFLRLQYREAVAELRARRATAGNGGNTIGETPGIDEVAQYLGVPARRLEEAKLAERRQTAQRILEDQIVAAEPTPEQTIVTNEDRAIVCAALRRLSPFEAWVICERFGLGHPTGHGIHWISADDDPANERDDPTGACDSSSADLTDESASSPRSGYPRSLLEIGKDCGLSVFRLRQVEKTALDKLRGLLDSHITDLT